MGVNVKLGVDLSSFKQGINDANAQLKTFDAQLKFAETNFKKTGDAEAAMSTKTDALTNKLKVQRQMLQQYDKALKDMRTAGIDPTSASYQKMEAAMLNVQSASIETEIALQSLNVSQLDAAKSADKLTDSVNSIGKKISLDQVISGIDKITGSLENAGKKAISLGENIWNDIMNSARLADDVGTAAMLLDMDVEEYQQYKGVFDTIAEMTVNDWMNAKRKVQKAINDPSDDQTTVLSLLGVSTHDMRAGKYGVVQDTARAWEDVFWDAATQLKKQVENGRISQDLADTYAEALFGKKATSLKALIDLGREGFDAALKEQNTASAEAIQKDAELADTITKLSNSYEALKMELTSGFAPALTEAAKAFDNLSGKVIDYLKSPEGKETLEHLRESVSGLFDDLDKIDPQQVVEYFSSAFDTVTSSLKWLVENKDTVVATMKGIVIGWGGLKLTGAALDVVKLVEGIKGLSAAEGAAAGASWGSAFAGAVASAAPWLVGLYTILKPSSTNDNSLISNGSITQEGYFEFARQVMENPEYKNTMMQLGTILGADPLSKLMSNAAAITDIWNYLINGQTGYSNALTFANDVLGKYTGTSFAENWLGVEFTEEELNSILQGMNLVLTPTFYVPENAVNALVDQIGTLKIPAEVYLTDSPGGSGTNEEQAKVNGFWSVPYDGYIAQLHRGEQVVSAREVASRNFSSNLYIENNYMNRDMDADALANAIASRNRRMMSGYGS